MDISPIERAIAEGRLLHFAYGEHARVVEPFTYGQDRHGARVLVAYQVDGGSRTGQSHGWKTFRERDMRGIVVAEAHFARSRPGYRRNDGGLASIIAQI